MRSGRVSAPASLVTPSCYSCSEATQIRWYDMSEEMMSVIMTNGTYRGHL